MKQTTSNVLGFLMLAVLCAASYFLFDWLLGTLSTLDKNVIAALIVAAAATATALRAKYIENRHSVEAQFRKDKVELFKDFYALFDSFRSDNAAERAQETVEFLQQWQQKLLFWCSPSVVNRFLDLRHGLVNAKTVEDVGKSLETMGKLILDMRKDVGLKKGTSSTSFPNPLGTISCRCSTTRGNRTTRSRYAFC